MYFREKANRMMNDPGFILWCTMDLFCGSVVWYLAKATDYMAQISPVIVISTFAFAALFAGLSFSVIMIILNAKEIPLYGPPKTYIEYPRDMLIPEIPPQKGVKKPEKKSLAELLGTRGIPYFED
jgi:hypothetical protein